MSDTATARGGARDLNAAEIALARRVFADAIDYRRVRVHRRGYLWFGLQPRTVAMAPDGEVYFPEACFCEDFADPGRPWLGRWLVHELTHVWQYQLGYPVKWRGAVRLGLSYRYRLQAGRTLRDYDMEAQGELLADWFAARCLGRPDCVRDPAHRAAPDHLPRLERALAGFLADPRDPAHLPAVVAGWRVRGRGA